MNPRARKITAAALVLICVAVPSWSGEPGYGREVSPGLIAYMTDRFGQPAKPRLVGWSGFFLQQPAPVQGLEREKLLIARVNDFFNRVPFHNDIKHWGVEDYWASPAETVASHGADCEDFSIAKYYALKELGVPIARLRITYVKATRINQPHMVLAWYAKPDADPLILDNLVKELKPASERPDLIPVYSFNDEDVWLAKEGRMDGRAGKSSQIRLWRELLEKLDRETRL